MWLKILEWLAGKGIEWAQKALDERAAKDKAESEAIHRDVQGGGR